jgi:hypothetical protein
LILNDKEGQMMELEHNGYYPLTREHLDMYVPSRPGIYMLAIRLANGVHQTFFTSQSDNVYGSLRKVLTRDTAGLQLSQEVHECLARYQCYFSYWILVNLVERDGESKSVSPKGEPPDALTVINCN